MVASSRWFVHIPRHAAIPMFLLASVWVFLLGRTPVQIITGIATLASIALAQYSTRLVADRSDGDDHTLWASASTALTFLFLGEYVEMLLRMGAFRTSGPASALSFLAFVAAAMFAAPALWHVARPEIVSYSSLASYAVDLLVLVLTFLLGCLTLLLPSSVDGAALPASRFIPLVLYPSLEIGIIGYALVFKRTRWRPHEIALGCALAGLGLRDTIALTTAGAMTGAPPGSFASLPADLVLVCAYGAATVAAVIRLRAVAPEVRPLAPTGPVPDPVWPSFAAPLTAMLIAPVMLLRAMTHGWSDAQLWSAVVIAMLLGISFTFRSFLLNRENARLQLMSTTDPLTGLASHRQFHEQLDNELGRASRDGTPLTVAVFDVDDFDRVNNVYGHAVGDLRLKSIADLLRADARGTDVVCRVGGDEFAIIMPNTGSHDAYAVCLRVQASLGKARDAASVPISVSVGIATVPEHAADHEELVERADGALYWAKFHGRGRVVVFDPELIRALGPE